jgi:RNA polymerase sigma factor (sigma-70 family)
MTTSMPDRGIRTIDAWASALSRPLLEHEHACELAAAAQAGDDAARTLLLESNLRLVVNLARPRFATVRASQHMNEEELLQEGAIGLNRAITKFDTSKNLRFSTYATVWIKSAIGRYIDLNQSSVHVPVNVTWSIRNALRDNPAATPEQVAAAADISVEQATDGLAVYNVLSLDAPVRSDNPEGASLGQMLASTVSPDPADMVCDNTDFVQQARDLLARLPDEPRRIMQLRYGIGCSHAHTLIETAEAMGLDPTRVRVLEQRAVQTLRGNPTASSLAVDGEIERDVPTRRTLDLTTATATRISA